MGFMAIAGAISGAGQAASNSLLSTQNAIQTAQLQDLRDKADDMRQQRLIESNQKMQTTGLAATAAENTKNRAQTADENQKTRESHSADVGMQITSSEAVAEGNRASSEKIHKGTNLTNEKIHAETNRVNQLIAKGHDAVQRETNDASLKTSLASVINASEREITRLQTELLDPLKNNPNDPQVKLLRDSIETAKREVSAFRTRYQQLTGTKPAEAAPGPRQIVDPRRTTPVATAPAGMIQTQMPSSTEQEMMQRAIDGQ